MHLTFLLAHWYTYVDLSIIINTLAVCSHHTSFYATSSSLYSFAPKAVFSEPKDGYRKINQKYVSLVSLVTALRPVSLVYSKIN